MNEERNDAGASARFDGVKLIIDSLEQMQGVRLATMPVLKALIATHPEPEAFARELRYEWMRAGEPQSDDASSAAQRSGAEWLLAAVEQASRVPLGIRPDPEG